MTPHCDMPNPAAVQGPDAEKERAFRDAAITKVRRIELFLALPTFRLDRLALQSGVKDIGTR